MTVVPDFSGQINSGLKQGTDILANNVVALMALPVLWVGYRVAKKVLGKIG